MTVDFRRHVIGQNQWFHQMIIEIGRNLLGIEATRKGVFSVVTDQMQFL